MKERRSLLPPAGAPPHVSGSYLIHNTPATAAPYLHLYRPPAPPLNTSTRSHTTTMSGVSDEKIQQLCGLTGMMGDEVTCSPRLALRSPANCGRPSNTSARPMATSSLQRAYSLTTAVHRPRRTKAKHQLPHRRPAALARSAVPTSPRARRARQHRPAQRNSRPSAAPAHSKTYSQRTRAETMIAPTTTTRSTSTTSSRAARSRVWPSRTPTRRRRSSTSIASSSALARTPRG